MRNGYKGHDRIVRRMMMISPPDVYWFAEDPWNNFAKTEFDKYSALPIKSKATLISFQIEKVCFLLNCGIVHCSSPISAPWPFPVNLLELASLKNEIHLSPSGKLLIFFLSLNESKLESHYSPHMYYTSRRPWLRVMEKPTYNSNFAHNARWASE